MRIKGLLLLIVFLALWLRLFNLGNVPMSLNWDEASLGYNAYSISQTLRDEHGEFLPVARFIAFGDYKPPAYIYTAAVIIKFFGLSEFATRLPSALAGTFLVFLIFWFTKELFSNNRASLLSAFLMAVSPWAIQFSRGAYEANLATAFSVAGILFFLRGVRLLSFRNYFLSSIFFVLSAYTFNSHRFFVPLICIALGLIYFRKILSQYKKIIVFGLMSFVLVLPMLPHLLSVEGGLRFQEVTWLNDLAPIEINNKRMIVDGNDFISRLAHNRRLLYVSEFIKHYTDHFRGDFLFYSGDVNPRLSIQNVGELYWIDLPFLLIGLYFVYKKRNRSSVFLFSWMMLAPIPAALARETPHALRALVLMPPLLIFAAVGINEVRFKKLFVFLPVIYLVFIFVYLHNYYFHYAKNSAMEWQYGYKDMVSFVSSIENSYDSIVITQEYGRPYIYFLFYKQYSPQKYWLNRKVSRDYFGFWYVHSFGKYDFDGININDEKTLYVMGPASTFIPKKELKKIKNPMGQVVFNIFE